MSDRCRLSDRGRRGDGSRLDGRRWRDDRGWRSNRCWSDDRRRCGDRRRLDGGGRRDGRSRSDNGHRSDDRLGGDDGSGGRDGYRSGDGDRRGDRCWRGGRCWRDNRGRCRCGDGLDGQGRCLSKRRGHGCLSGFSLQAVAGCGRILLCQVARRWCVVVCGASAAAACAQQQGRESKGQGLGNVRSAHGREVRKEWRRRIVDRCRTFRGVIRGREMLLPGGGQRP